MPLGKIDINKLTQFITPERLNKINIVLHERTRYLTIIMENLYDPHNTSAVIRSCEAYGLQDFHIIELENKFQLSRRVSQGSHNWVNLYKYQSSKTAITHLQKKGYKIYFADPREEYPNLDELDLSSPTALVFGQEKQGITEETKKFADGAFRIPMYGFVESFNVSVTCAIAISHLSYRLRKNPPENFHLSTEEKDLLFHYWLAKNTLIGNVLKRNNVYQDYLIKDEYLIQT